MFRLGGASVWMTVGLAGLLVASTGCGGPSSKRKRPTICDLSIKRLKSEVGPEFGRVLSRSMVKRDKRRAHGCAVIYRRMAEETADELPEGERLDYQVDDRLAIGNTGGRRGLRHFQRIRPSRNAPGPVAIKMKTADLTGDGAGDFIIQEQAAIRGAAIGYKGLRIFDGGLGPSAELLSIALNVKTKEGLEIIAAWRIVPSTKGPAAIVLEGAGEQTTYRFDAAARRFVKQKTQPKRGLPPAQLKLKKPPKASPKNAAPAKAAPPEKSKSDKAKPSDELPDFLKLSP